MKTLPPDPELLAMASRVVWFESPERAIANPVRFLAYVMTYGTPEELAVMRRFLEPDDLREAVEKAPPGIFDERSWIYWNLVTGREPVPPMPQRKFEGA